MIITQIDRSIEVLLDARLYNIDVVHKCFYWYGATFVVDIQLLDNELVKVILFSKNEDDLTLSFDKMVGKIRNDIIDFKLRDLVTKETQNVRDLLIAKAFAYYETDEEPHTDVSDPVGFNPNFNYANND